MKKQHQKQEDKVIPRIFSLIAFQTFGRLLTPHDFAQHHLVPISKLMNWPITELVLRCHWSPFPNLLWTTLARC